MGVPNVPYEKCRTFRHATDFFRKHQRQGLRLAPYPIAHTPFAMVVDEPAYRTQLIQLLGRGQGDSEYFEPIATNKGGRVFRLKK